MALAVPLRALLRHSARPARLTAPAFTRASLPLNAKRPRAWSPVSTCLLSQKQPQRLLQTASGSLQARGRLGSSPSNPNQPTPADPPSAQNVDSNRPPAPGVNGSILTELSTAAPLLSNPLLVVSRKLEMLNLFLGYEQANRYALLNRHAQVGPRSRAKEMSLMSSLPVTSFTPASVQQLRICLTLVLRTV